jgi:acetoacetyl-CoA reductase
MKKNILITGGTRGIGKALALNFLKNKDTENVIVIHKNNLKDDDSLINSGIHFYKMDVTNHKETCFIITEIIQKFSRIDVLINNVGILKNSLFHKMEYDDWLAVINTNLISLYNVTFPVIQNMILHNYGRIINIASICGIKGSKGQTNYCASKFGVVGFTKSLALEYSDKNILVNCICPGLTETDMIKDIREDILNKIISNQPIKKLIDVNEIYELCNTIVNSNCITGSVFTIDCGMSC